MGKFVLMYMFDFDEEVRRFPNFVASEAELRPETNTERRLKVPCSQ